jgi:hypothetical protein
MDFLTGSVVVPATSETTACSWPEIAFKRLDLPALRLPKMPMFTRSDEGVWFKRLLSYDWYFGVGVFGFWFFVFVFCFLFFLLIIFCLLFFGFFVYLFYFYFFVFIFF